MSKFKADINLTYLSLIDEYMENVDGRDSEFLADLYNIVIWEIRNLTLEDSNFKKIVEEYNLIVDNFDENLMAMFEEDELDKYSFCESCRDKLYYPCDLYMAIVDGKLISSDDFFNGDNPSLYKGIISTLAYRIKETNPQLATQALKNILTKFIEEME